MKQARRFDATNGYWLVNVKGHPLFPNKSWVAEHRVMMAEHLGRPLLSSEIVHHRDHDKTNNVISNFKLTNRADHCREHNADMCTPERNAKIQLAAARVGADPEERARRAERAKLQHAQGNFGHHVRSYE